MRTSATHPPLAPVLRAIALTIVSAFSLSTSNADVVSTFDSGTDGWSLAPGSFGSLTQSPSGGNPGGYLKNDPTDGADVAVLQAPAEFVGDLRLYHGGTFSFDATLISGSGGSYFLFGLLSVRNGSTTREFDLVSGAPPLGSWGSYAIPLDAETWGFADDPAAFHAFLAGVTEITIGAEAIFGAEVNGFDNIAFRRGEFTIALSGSCPGSATLTATGATPGGRIALLRAFAPGSQVIPSGYPCAGTTLGLNASVDLALSVNADSSGTLILTRTLPAAACGNIFIQAVDLSSCATSNVLAID